MPERELLKKYSKQQQQQQQKNYLANEKLVINSELAIILGDCMIKDLNGWEMSKKVNNPDRKVYVKHFAGVKTTCMKDYLQPSLKNAKPLHPLCWH